LSWIAEIRRIRSYSYTQHLLQNSKEIRPQKTKTWDDDQKRRPKGEDERQFKQKLQTEIRRKLKKEETSPQKSKNKEE